MRNRRLIVLLTLAALTFPLGCDPGKTGTPGDAGSATPPVGEKFQSPKKKTAN